MASYSERVQAATAMHSAPNALVSRILQVALGLFVTTSDLPTMPVDNPLINFDCSFDADCRWMSAGNHIDRWRIARGEPDSLLWLAATGTMQLPTQPFALVEIKGQQTDVLISDTIACQTGASSLSFVYWAIGNADLEVCLTDLAGVKFNCTGMLDSPVMPGKVLLKIPEMDREYRIMISSNAQNGVLIVDDIKYDGNICENVGGTTKRHTATTPIVPFAESTTVSHVRRAPQKEVALVLPTDGFETGGGNERTTIGARRLTAISPTVEPSIVVPPTIFTTTLTTFTTFLTNSSINETSSMNEDSDYEGDLLPEAESSTETEVFKTSMKPSDKSTPINIPKIVDEIDETPKTTISILEKLAKWRKTSVATTPSPTTTTTTTTEAPTTTMSVPPTTTDIPFDLLIYGNLTSPFFDRRQNMIVGDSAKLLCDFKEEFACQWGAEAGRWAIVREGAIPSLEEDIGPDTLPPTFPAALVLQGTVMLTSDPMRCQSEAGKVLFRAWSNGNVTIQVCALGYGIDNQRIQCYDRQPASAQDASLAVYEIPEFIREPFTLNIVPQWDSGVTNKYLIIDEIAYIGECVPVTTKAPSTTVSTTVRTVFVTDAPRARPMTPESLRETEEGSEQMTSEEDELTEEEEEEEEEEQMPVTVKAISIKPHKKTRTYPTRTISTTTTPEPTTIETTTRPNVQGARLFTPSPRTSDYCTLLNCNFDDNACNYLNHGLTKVPWTLRNKAYGYPLTPTTDVRPNPANLQFVSSLLSPGDVAILESPKFNLSSSLNVLLFQYYRPSQSSTIRLCLGSRLTTPLRTVNSFTRCPSILRAVTARNAYRWNTVHVQLPPGTTHFFLVAHNNERAETRASVAFDNMRVAICDPKNFAPEEVSRMFSSSSFLEELRPEEEAETHPRAHGLAQYRPEHNRRAPSNNYGVYGHSFSQQTKHAGEMIRNAQASIPNYSHPANMIYTSSQLRPFPYPAGLDFIHRSR